MFGPFIVNQIRMNKSSLVITVQWSWMRLKNSKIAEKVTKPFEFAASDSHEMIFVLGEEYDTMCCLFDFQEIGE